MTSNDLKPRQTPGAQVNKTPTGWQLMVPTGNAGTYRLAQLDNYSKFQRKNFPENTPTKLSLRCRASSASCSGTWGFGFWNDPFAFSLGLKGTVQRLPALPNACWFFHASPENHLSFHDPLPGKGFLVQSFRSPQIPSLIMAPGILVMPFLKIKIFSRWLRAVTGRIINEDSRLLDLDVTGWHQYTLYWNVDRVRFEVDGRTVLESPTSPQGPLGVVIWLDNQFAAWNPSGGVSMGSLQQNSDGWLEIENLQIEMEA